MLVLKWYGIELKGNIYDTMLVHYVVEPEKAGAAWIC